MARGALAEAAKSLDPGLRYRALYNLGLVGLLAAEADTTRQEEFLDDAADRLRQALLLQPSSERAKWNLELADRRRRHRRAEVAAGRRSHRHRAAAASQQPQRQAEPPQQGLSQSQAEQILNSMERRERETRTEQQRRLQAGGRRSEGLVIALLLACSRCCREAAPRWRPPWTRTGSPWARSWSTRSAR